MGDIDLTPPSAERSQRAIATGDGLSKPGSSGIAEERYDRGRASSVMNMYASAQDGNRHNQPPDLREMREEIEKITEDSDPKDDAVQKLIDQSVNVKDQVSVRIAEEIDNILKNYGHLPQAERVRRITKFLDTHPESAIDALLILESPKGFYKYDLDKKLSVLIPGVKDKVKEVMSSSVDDTQKQEQLNKMLRTVEGQSWRYLLAYRGLKAEDLQTNGKSAAEFRSVFKKNGASSTAPAVALNGADEAVAAQLIDATAKNDVEAVLAILRQQDAARMPKIRAAFSDVTAGAKELDKTVEALPFGGDLSRNYAKALLTGDDADRIAKGLAYAIDKQSEETLPGKMALDKNLLFDLLDEARRKGIPPSALSERYAKASLGGVPFERSLSSYVSQKAISAEACERAKALFDGKYDEADKLLLKEIVQSKKPLQPEHLSSIHNLMASRTQEQLRTFLDTACKEVGIKDFKTEVLPPFGGNYPADSVEFAQKQFFSALERQNGKEDPALHASYLRLKLLMERASAFDTQWLAGLPVQEQVAIAQRYKTLFSKPGKEADLMNDLENGLPQ